MTDPDAWSDDAFHASFAQVPRGAPTTSASILVEVAQTGAAPILAVTSDGRRFWLKWPGNPHGNLSLVNELVVARIGQLIDAPVRPVSLVYVDPELTTGFRANGLPIPGGTYFGSELLADVEEATEILRVEHDGNAQRFPRFLALWELCLGADLQLLYHVSNDHQVWSIDHGLWFDNQEGDWTPSLLQQWRQVAWSWPDAGRPKGLDPTGLHGAADAVLSISLQSLAQILAEVPQDWGIQDKNLAALAEFIYYRRNLVANQLRTIAAHYA